MSDCIGTGCKAASLMERIAALEAERDALKADVIEWQDCALVMQTERDAWKSKLLAEEVEHDATMAERDALREMVTLATSVHTMTDEQLDELRANAQATIDAAREKP